MKRIFSNTLITPKSSSLSISDEEAHHLTKVLRSSVDDPVEILDGRGHKIRGTLQKSGKGWYAECDPATFQERPLRQEVAPITLEMAVTKSDSFEWVIEKCVELGVEKLVPLITERTVVRIHEKGADKFLDRWNKIAEQSLKQCGRLHALQIAQPTEILPYLAIAPKDRYWCFEQETEFLLANALTKHPQTEPCQILIGPEGGFAPSEIQILKNLSPKTRACSLGLLTLRAETAALFSVSLAVAPKLDTSS